MRDSTMSSREDFVFFGYDIYNCFSPASEEEICKLEQKIGSSLPGDYRRFLATFNGGIFSRTLKVSKRSDPSNASDSPRQLFAIGHSVQTSPECDLVEILGRCTWHPSWFLPIGSSTLHDAIGLGLKNETFGAVYVFDYRLHAEGVPAEDCAFRLADSFHELFEQSSLRRPHGRPHPHPAFRAIEEADFDMFRKLVVTAEEANREQESGWYLFWCLNQPRFVQHLLAIGADPHVRNDGECPLNHCEVYETAKLLLQHGANPESLSREGYTPLLQTRNFRIHEALLAAGADVNFVARDGLCLDVETGLPGLRDLWQRYGLDRELLCDRLCRLISDPDSSWESIEEDEETPTVAEDNLVRLVRTEPVLLRRVTEIQNVSRNSLVQSRVRRVLRRLATGG